MKIAVGVETLELQGKSGKIHPTLIWDEGGAILVDVGYPGQLQEITASVNMAGVPLSELNKIIITHQDFDHIGCLKEILMDHKIEVIAHNDEKPYLEGEKPLIKMTPERLAGMFESLSAEQRSEAQERFLQSLRSNVQQAVVDGEVLPYCGGITVIHTPGHTPGHICLYLNRSRTLIAGDALNVADGELIGANPVHTLDMKQAKKSIGKLVKYDIATVICYHGGVYTKNVNSQLRELAGGNM